MTEDDILETRHSQPDGEESDKTLPATESRHVEAGYVDVVEHMMEGGLVVNDRPSSTNESAAPATEPDKKDDEAGRRPGNPTEAA